MNQLALIPLLATPTLFALVLMGGLAAGGPTGTGVYSVEVAVNVESDPGGHAEFIDLPANIKLDLAVGSGKPPGITILGPVGPWVPVRDPLFEIDDDLPFPFQSFTAINAVGTGLVAGFINIAVSFTGQFDPNSPSGQVLTGFYTMGVAAEGANLLPGGQPIVYRIKPKPGGSVLTTPTPHIFPEERTPAATATEEAPPTHPTATPGKRKLDFIFINPGPNVGGRVNLRFFGLANSPRIVADTTGCTTEPSLELSIGDFAQTTYFSLSWGKNCVQPGEGFTLSILTADPFFDLDRQSWFKELESCPAGGLSCPLSTGDVNGDGTVNAIDASLVLQFNAGLLEVLPFPENGDVNGDGATTSVDAAIILQFDAGLIPDLPVGSSPTPNTPTVTPTATATPSPTSLAPLTPPPPTATGTATPTPTTGTGNVTIRKVELDNGVVTDESAAGWEMRVYSGGGCGGSVFISGSTSGTGLTLGLSPGSYSVAETEQAGWVAISSICQSFTVEAGEEIEIVFQNERIP